MTDEEFAAAQAAVSAEEARRAEEAAQADAARRAPLLAITGSDSFADVQVAIAALPADLRLDIKFHPHLTAIEAGMQGLLKLAPRPAPID